MLEFRRSTALLMVPSPAAGCRLPQPLPARTAARRRASPRPVFRKFCSWFPFVSASPPCSTPSCLLHLHLLLLCSLQTSGRAPGAALDEGWVLPARTQYKAGAPRAATRSFPISHSSSPSLLPPCFAFFLHLPPHPTPPLLFLFFSSTPSVFPPSTAAFSMIKTRNKASRGLQPGLAACARAASSKSLLVHSHREKPRLPALPVHPETNQELN